MGKYAAEVHNNVIANHGKRLQKFATILKNSDIPPDVKENLGNELLSLCDEILEESTRAFKKILHD